MCKKIKSSWRRLFSKEYTRADYNYQDVWINTQKFRLVRCEDSYNQEGKWLLFTPLDKFLGRCSSPTLPSQWADDIINKEIK
jgi:hypothetical protein